MWHSWHCLMFKIFRQRFNKIWWFWFCFKLCTDLLMVDKIFVLSDVIGFFFTALLPQFIVQSKKHIFEGPGWQEVIWNPSCWNSSSYFLLLPLLREELVSSFYILSIHFLFSLYLTWVTTMRLHKVLIILTITRIIQQM